MQYILMPFSWLLLFFYHVLNSYGLALILFAVVIKVILFPVTLKGKKSMIQTTMLSGKMQQLQKQYGKDRERYNLEVQKLYEREHVNPMGGCLWSMIPLVLLIALYAIIRQPLRYLMGLSVDTISAITDAATKLGYTVAEGGQAAAYEQIYLAKFVHQNWDSFQGQFDGLINLDYNFLGMDLASQGSQLFKQITTGGWPVIGVLLLPVIATALQFLMTLISMKATGNAAGSQGKMMMYLMPLMTLWMGYILPAALCVYWIANTAFATIQEQVLNKYFNKILDREETDKERAKREARAAKMMASRERMLQQQQQYEKSKSGNNSNKKKNQAAKKPEKKAGTNENGRVGQRPYARGRAYSEHHYDE